MTAWDNREELELAEAELRLEPEDPNASLIGQSLEINDRMWIVVATWPLGANYVVLEDEDETTIIRPVGVIRRALELARPVEDDYSEEAMP